MIRQNKSKNGGFIALMSAIIISFVLLIMITNLSLTGFYNRFNILDSELKERSSAIAEACVDVAILRMAQGTTVPGDVIVNGDKCTIVSEVGGTITIKADYKHYVTNLKVVVDSDFKVLSWEEI